MPDFFIEEELIQKGYKYIAGIDEAGRGPLAGPVVAAAVILPRDYNSDILNDSKKISPKVREKLYEELTDPLSRVAWGYSVISPEIIDEINILNATHRAMSESALNLETEPSFAIIDGNPVKGFPYPYQAVVKGDEKCLSIAAASIIAKVERDRLMLKYAEKYPEYGFERHKGYGTKLHLNALKEFGASPIHRQSFAPVRAAQGLN
ncbi:MAG: ribonuclease HII [Verrucomicrobiota bacterium]|nr:ribonuclease HII [Verrucomicrobiota bacterium]